MKTKFKVGDRVRPKIEKEAYYSNYAGNPKVILNPTMVGTVASVEVPWVRREGVFNCVDFEIPGVFNGNPKHENITWRGAFTDAELQKI